jgi:hypothetical protein
MTGMNGSRALRGRDYKVTDEERPGWVRGSTRIPAVGETVYCAGGEGTVVSVQGRTGDGSRLVQIRLDTSAAPFFAAGSNVLLAPA